MTGASSPETSLAQLQHQLDAARAELQDFIYAVSHDLRAPLRHINAYAQIIQEDWPDLPAEMAGHLGTIRQSAQLLTQQLDGLTQLSRLGLQPLNLLPVNVGALAQEVADELTAQHPQQVVQWQLAADVPPVLADAALLRQVLVQLLGNALKFSRGRTPAIISLTWRTTAAAGHGWPDVEPAPGGCGTDGIDGDSQPMRHPSDQILDQRSGPAACRISIADNGVGFKPEQAKALFKVFGRLHPERAFDGLGLGLVSCRKMVERLGGRIVIEGATDAGCCVTVTLPLAK